MKFHEGQKVWVWRGDSEKPYPATISGYLGKSSTGNDVYEFVTYWYGCQIVSGCADFDIYETEILAKHAYEKYTDTK